MKIENVNDEDVKVTKKSTNKEEDSIVYTEISGLPSDGKLYSNNVNIKGRPLKMIELKKLSTMTGDNSDSVMYDVLRSSIKGIEIDQILSPDKLYLIFWLRANTYREAGYSVDYFCKLCNKQSSYDFNLTNLQVKYLDKEFSTDKLKFTLTNNDEISYHLMKISDEKLSNKFQKTYASILPNMNESDVNYAVQIDSINGEELELVEKYEYVVGLEPKLYSQLKGYMKRFEFGIKTELNVTCNKCGGISPVGVIFQEEFFIPDYKVA